MSADASTAPEVERTMHSIVNRINSDRSEVARARQAILEYDAGRDSPVAFSRLVDEISVNFGIDADVVQRALMRIVRTGESTSLAESQKVF